MYGWREDDVLLPTNSRTQLTNQASVTSLFYTNPSAHRQDYRSVYDAGLAIELWDPRSGKMSASRRTFCLIATFDLIFTFLLWIIYTQLIRKHRIWEAVDDQVLGYTFEYSLFDTVMMSCTRFTFIMLAYALCRINHVWVIAVTTSITCAYLLVKCFLFEFSDAVLGGKNPFSYIVLIVSFVLAWVETWMLDFRVLPVEQILRERARLNDRQALLSSDRNESITTADSERQYFSPYHTPEGSEDESEIQNYQSLPSTNSHSSQASGASLYSAISNVDIEVYMKLIDKMKVAMWDIIHVDGWKMEKGNNLNDGIVYSKHMKEYGRKIFKLQGIVNMSPKDHWHSMIEGLNDSPKWNTTILESRDLQVIDDTSVVTYNISADTAGGLVSARDFINVRHWYEQSDIYMSIAMGATHPDMPVQKKYVRGDNGPGGWSFESVPGEPNQCLFSWVVNTNLKGWLPQTIIDQAMGGVLVQFFKLMTEHLAEDNSQRLVL